MALNLIANYFCDRFQTVKYENKKSTLLSINLGVPQGSILGPLFFLIFIIYLGFIVDLNCKMFADDTTLYESDSNTNTLISKFKKKLEPLFDWCKYNKLDINWSKTYFMFVTNKRVMFPKEIIIKNVTIQVVDDFKLLGITLDNKLNFIKHSSLLKKIINRKLFSIKRLFFLATSVKIQFFKTFILPYFDYCLSLSIYFPKSTLQMINNCFNLCLYRLFKFKPDTKNLDLNDDEENKIIDDFEKKLESYGLFTFQSRIFNKFLNFTHFLKNHQNAPCKLKEAVNTQFAENSDNCGEYQNHQNGIFELRSGNLIKNEIPNSKFGNLTFLKFFPKFIFKFKNINFSLNKNSFTTLYRLNFKTHLNSFIFNFSKFAFTYASYYKKKYFNKRKNN